MIKRTKEYDLFKFDPSNRLIRTAKVKQMTRDIKAFNLLDKHPILVDSHMVVKDGQHRLMAAKTLGEYIYYEVIEDPQDTAMIILNNNQNRWTLSDFLHHYVTRKYPEYIRLTELINKYPFIPKTSLIGLLMGKSTSGSAHAMQLFREGKFAITNEDMVKRLLEQVREIEEYLMPGVIGHRVFYTAYKHIFYHKEFDFEQLLERFKISGIRLHQFQTSKEYIQAIENIYNFRMQKATRFY